MATATLNFGSIANLVVTALQSLVDDGFWQSDEQDNSAIKGFWAEIFLTIVTTTTVGDANGVINLRVASGYVTTALSGQLTGSEGAYLDTLNRDHRHTDAVRSFSCDASEATARTYKYRAVIHNLSEFLALLIENKSGATLASAGNEVRVRIHKYDSA